MGWRDRPEGTAFVNVQLQPRGAQVDSLQPMSPDFVPLCRLSTFPSQLPSNLGIDQLRPSKYE